MLKYKSIGLTARSGMTERDSALRSVAGILRSLDAKVLVDAKRCGTIPRGCGEYSDPSEVELMVILGGDGTILRAVREMGDLHVPLLSINRGTVGFLSELTLEECPRMLPKLLKGDGVIDERSMLDVVAFRGREELWKGRVLNEVVIAQGAISRLIDLKTTVDGKALTTFHADGVIIATPTGSTAYSLAAGGPIVHPQLKATIVTPINPHSFTQKPIILPADDMIEVRIDHKPNKFSDVQISLTMDGQTYVSLRGKDRLCARISRETVKFLRRKEDTFFETLRNKLKWGERIESE